MFCGSWKHMMDACPEIATIEAKWNLPALTYRDANAHTVMDFLDPSTAAFMTPPTIAGPSLTGPSGPVL